MSCVSVESGQVIVRQQRGRVVRFRNESHDPVEVVEYDGCVVKEVSAVDYLFHFRCGTTVFVELKGRDVERALKQLSESLRRCVADSSCAKTRIALIVSSQSPAGVNMTKIQEALRRSGFHRTKIKTGHWEGAVEQLK